MLAHNVLTGSPHNPLPSVRESTAFWCFCNHNGHSTTCSADDCVEDVAHELGVYLWCWEHAPKGLKTRLLDAVRPR